MKRNPYILLLVILASFFLSCQTVPITGREQLSFVPASQILPMSFNQYQDFLSKHKVVDQGEQAALVKRVGSRIEHAVERYFAEHGLSSRLAGYQWEFHLVDDKEVNAWCMPGGKVVVYTGILPVTKDENGLGVVLGHEIAHAVANHGGERMSQSLLVEMGGLTLDAALSQNPSKTNDLFLAAYGLGTQVGILLPYSRTQESEADHLGLIFMAMAGYDPHGAVTFWERMIASQHGKTPPELLSDHPADARRIENIKGLLPEAMQYYRPES
ncbi:MAG TPA: M48 family metallopeptidase [Nitrospirota bacterium]|nr:M48 family metallopeptidase [Nitrospirota bacterium]